MRWTFPLVSLAVLAWTQASNAGTPDQIDRAMLARFGVSHTGISWVEKRRVGSEVVACGMANDGALFIVRHGHVFIMGGNEVPLSQFNAWGDKFCGPYWVNPRQSPPAVP